MGRASPQKDAAQRDDDVGRSDEPSGAHALSTKAAAIEPGEPTKAPAIEPGEPIEAAGSPANEGAQRYVPL
jgi:hypothetical protein